VNGLSILGTAESFAVLAGSTVTNTGPTNVVGNLGVSPGLAVTGFPPGLVAGGVIHSGDGVAQQAEQDVTTAYNALAGRACNHDLTGVDLGGRTLTAGVYCFSSSAQLTGTLTLDAQGNPDAVFVFQIASTLTTASNASVVVVNGAQPCNTFWQVGSSATLGTTTSLVGSILALTSITLDTGATVAGRALARNGAVTMDTNRVAPLACRVATDAGVADGGAADAGPTDGGPPDSGVIDSGAIDSGPADVGTPDAGVIDSGVIDSGVIDSGVIDSGPADVGTPDAGVFDSGAADAGTPDAGTPDVGTPDAGTPDVGVVDSGTPDASLACCPGSVACGEACVDLTSDGANCGACGHACAAGARCQEGVCEACATVCGGECTDLRSDSYNCGACGSACASDRTCTGGVCVRCPTLCGGSCADLTTSGSDCGACGHACAETQQCVASVCRTTPPADCRAP
jgi:hypothetical protein